MDYADKVCDLECVKKGPPTHEFVGPVKIILVEPLPEDYKRKSWGSALLTMAMLIMGVVVFTVFFFTLRFKFPLPMNSHIFLCTMGFQLFMPSGILMINSLFGGAAHLKTEDRKCQHVFLQVFAIVCGVGGSAIVFFFGEMKFTLHSITGLIASVLTICSSIIGPTVYFTNQTKSYGKFNKCAHIYFAIPTVVMATLSFILGLMKESFVKWAIIQDFHKIIIIFTLIYTGAVLISVYFKAKLDNQ